MGAFRNFIEGLFKSLIGDKIDAVKDKFDTSIKTPLVSLKGAFVSEIKQPIVSFKDATTGKLTDIKEGILEIPSSIGEIKVALGDLKDKLPKPIASFIDIQTWFNPLLAPLKAIDKIHEIASGKKPEEVEWAGNLIGRGVQSGVKLVTEAALKNIQEVLNEVYDEEGFPQETRDKVNKLAASGEFGLNAVVGFMLGHFLSPVLSTSLAPVWEGMGQEAWKKLSVRNIDPATLLRLKYKGLIEDSYFVDVMKQHGYNETTQKNMLDDFLWLPTVGDVIRWSVREAFAEEYVIEYDLDKDYPDKLNKYGEKIGISPEELKYFWRSHWELPSVMQGYEMLHRTRSSPMYSGQQPSGTSDGKPYYTVITSGDLDNLFMAADVLPWWRDKLKAISYHNYTRVDVRRLFKTGILSRDEVKMSYLDQGYEEEKAENLTEFTVRDTLSAERDLTRGHIENLYKEGQITTEVATEDLISLGYDVEESALLIMLIDIKLEDVMDKDLIATWETLFKIHVIDLSTLTANIESLNVTLEKKNRIIAKAQRIEIGFVTQPPKADLMNWFEAGIISEAIFKTKMLGLGYSIQDVGYYMQEMKT